MKKIKVAIIGQGRSGRDIHGKYFKSAANVNFEVAYVVEADEFRRNAALSEYPGCKVFSDYKELFEIKDIDLVVNASFSEMHYAITKDLLLHGFNVLCEKPMARTYFECTDLIKTAKDMGVTLAVFQQSFFAPHYMHAKEIVNSGKLGDIMQVSIRYNNFARRWDWQTLHKKVAGGLYNTGPHPVGLALGFLDFDENTTIAFSKLGRAMTSGDSDDFAKVIFTAPNKPIVDLEVSSNDAYSPFNIKIQGSRGTYSVTLTDYKMKYIVDGENEPKPVIEESLRNTEGFPIYCKENLIAHEEEGKLEGSVFEIGSEIFYDMLYKKLTEGTPLSVTPEHAAKIINIIETVHAQNPSPVLF